MTRRIISLDTEDDSQGHLKSVGFFYDEDVFRPFFTPTTALEHLLTLGRSDVWAVNMEYDLMNLFRGRESMLDLTYNGTRFISGRLRGSPVKFFDLLNHVQASVEKLGQMIGLEKLPFDPDDLEYLRRDCEIVYRFLTHYLFPLYEVLKIGRVAFTLPSVSMRYYFQKHAPSDMEFKPVEGFNRAFLEAAYFGGRVEVFRSGWVDPGSQRVFSEDVRSMYPACMLEPLPDFRVWNWRRTWEPGETATVEAILEIPRQFFAPLPHRGSKLIYPVGRVRGVWNSIEIERAVSGGAKISKVIRALHFPRLRRFLKSFVEDIYEQRLQADGAVFKKLFKIFLNSLYGKFGQGNTVTRLRPIPEGYCGPVIGGMALIEEEGDYPRFSNVVWSSWITSLARIRLLNMMERVREDRICYVDTDSVIYISDAPIFNEGEALGSVGLEGDFDLGYFLAPKMYGLFGRTDRVRVKGVPSLEARKFLFSQTATYRKPNRFRESVRRGVTPNEWLEITKAVRSEYTQKIRRGDRFIPPIVREHKPSNNGGNNGNKKSNFQGKSF